VGPIIQQARRRKEESNEKRRAGPHHLAGGRPREGSSAPGEQQAHTSLPPSHTCRASDQPRLWWAESCRHNPQDNVPVKLIPVLVALADAVLSF